MSDRHPDIDTPPLESIGELLVDEHSEFTARCLAHVAPFVLRSNWEFERDLVTRGSK